MKVQDVTNIKNDKHQCFKSDADRSQYRERSDGELGEIENTSCSCVQCQYQVLNGMQGKTPKEKVMSIFISR